MRFRLTVYPAIEAGNPWTTFSFETRAELEAAKNTVADLLIFMQDQAKVMDDYSNMIVAEWCRADGEWEGIDYG